MMETPKPLMDDSYWFLFSKELTQTALTRRDKAATALQSLAKWLWGLYTAATATGFALADKSLSLRSAGVITLGSVSLVVVYWVAQWVQMPRLVE